MRSKDTIRRWLKDLETEHPPSIMENYKQGAIMALKCLLYNWPPPSKFLQVGKTVVVCSGNKAKLIKRQKVTTP